MKLRALAVLIGAILIGAVAPVPAATAAPIVSVVLNNIRYEADAGNPAAGARVTGVTNVASSRTIASNVAISGTSYPVTRIGFSAFAYSGLTSVTLPPTLISIDTAAFSNNSLVSLTIPDSVQTIGDRAFRLNSLTALTLGTGVTTVGAFAFGENSLTSVNIPPSVTTIGEGAFQSNFITSLTLSPGLTILGPAAFFNNMIPTVTLPGTVTSIGEYAFSTNSLSTVTIPSAVTGLHAGSFQNNPLTTATFTGPAPSAMGLAVFGTADPLITFAWRYGAARQPGGYTTPTWAPGNYRTQAITTADFSDDAGSPPPAQDVLVGGLIAEPVEPIRTGYTFAGWYTTATGGTTWDFADPITGDLTLHARWHALATVTYLDDSGAPPPAEQLTVGQTVTEPAEPTRTGQTFAGWYTTATGGTTWDFADPIAGDLTLHARWESIPTPVAPTPEEAEQPEAQPEGTATTHGIPATGASVGPLALTGALALTAGALLTMRRKRATR